MQNIGRLIEEHNHMDDMALDLMNLVRSPEQRALDAFTLLRRLSGSLDEHLAGEEGFLYADHFRAAPNRLEEEIIAFEHAFEDMKEEWSIYLAEWTLDNIMIDWRNFDHATQWIMGRLRERIAQENEILYPMALHYGRIRLQDPDIAPRPRFNADGACI
jgi:hypothetical protein